jgi:hypothetical protein
MNRIVEISREHGIEYVAGEQGWPHLPESGPRRGCAEEGDAESLKSGLLCAGARGACCGDHSHLEVHYHGNQ